MRSRLSTLLWILVLLLASSAHAQQTGSVSGIVQDDGGQPLPGATVTIKGPMLPAGQVEVSRENGAFDFERLPPGDYEITAELSGMGTAQRAVIVAVGRDTQVNLDLGGASLSEEITVTAATPIIDVRSTEVQVNYTQEAIEDLPIARNYKGLFQLAPGVSDNGRGTEGAGAPNAGGARQDNTFLVDGINITNPHYGDVLPNITELDIDEVNIKRAGISAEFGRTGGMVVNAVTRSGTNDLAGQVRFEYQPADFVGDSDLANLQNTIDREGIAGSIGGPFVRDKAWFYGSASFPTETTTDRINNLGAVPDREISTDEFFLKLTSNPSMAHYISASVRTRDTTTDNANITANVLPAAGSNDSTDYLLGTLGWTWNLTGNSFIDAKFNHNEEENSTSPLTDLGYRPAFDPAHPELMGRFTTTADRIVGGAKGIGQIVGGIDLGVNNQDFERDELRATFQTLQGWWGADHDLRFGVTYDENAERLERRANGWGNITWNPTTRQFIATYVSDQPAHTARGEALGVFLQDEMTLGQRTTLMLGLLVNKDNYYGEAFNASGGKDKVKILTFDWDQQIQPRLGVSFIPNVTAGDKLYFNFGRYYNTENKSLGRAASPTRIFTTRATFDAAGNLISNVPAANTQNKRIVPGTDPMYTDELVAGYARPLSRAWSAEAWGIYREVGNIFEDVSADGLGNGPFRVEQLPDAYREYTAATLQLNRTRIDDRFLGLTMNASYTWSRLEGNWDLDYGPNSLFYNSSFIQDGPGVLITDNRDGLLRGDRTHLLKVFTTISPWERARLGSYVRFQSGGAWEARGLPDANVSSTSHFRYLERAGSRRMEDWLNVDLLASYTFDFNVIGLELEGRVLNVLDEQATLEVDDRLIVGRATAPNNPNFGKPTLISQPRSFLVSAIVRY